MVRYIRSRDLRAERIIPVPKSWRFLPEEKQYQLAIGADDMPRFKLIFDPE